MEIYHWWLELDLAAKEWLRENLGAEELPGDVVRAIGEAGGPQENVPLLTPGDWDFIETQSQFVD